MISIENLMLPDGLPKTVIIGASGFIGSAFLTAYRKKHPDCVGTSRNTKKEGTIYFDICDPDLKPLQLAKTGHKEALILAAMTKIDECEREKQKSRKVNVEGTLELIRQLKEEGISPVYFSSDYVFNGKRGRYSDDDKPDPTTEYGRQKAEVESKIADICGDDHLIVRLSKVFSVQKGAGTLLDEIASILAAGGIVKAAYDQIFCPTYIWDVVNAIARLQAKGIKGTLNVCSPEIWPRYNIAVEIARKMGIDPSRVQKISIDDLGFYARRPKNISMVPKRLMAMKDISFAPLSECIGAVANNWEVKSL